MYVATNTGLYCNDLFIYKYTGIHYFLAENMLTKLAETSYSQDNNMFYCFSFNFSNLAEQKPDQGFLK